MAYSDTISLVQGDRLPQIQVTLKDSNTAASGQTLDPDNSATFAPLDLTGGTVRMRVRAVGSTTLTDTITGSITDATNGVCSFTFGSSTLATAGTLEAEVEFTDSSGLAQTVVDLLKFKVRSQFG